MDCELLEIISGLESETSFCVGDGALKEGLLGRSMAQEGAHEEIHEFELNASLRINGTKGSEVPSFAGYLEARDFQYRADLTLADFSDDEAAELLDLLRPYKRTGDIGAGKPRKNIIRKQKSGELANIVVATRRLGLSQRTLKSLIPCSETRIVKEGTERRIEEYYWDNQVIARFESLGLKQQERRGYNREDINFIATHCCDGDRDWARDCITRFLHQCSFAECNREDHA